jgi:steroid delta-isomerase-like uncharacterized protein
VKSEPWPRAHPEVASCPTEGTNWRPPVTQITSLDMPTQIQTNSLTGTNKGGLLDANIERNKAVIRDFFDAWNGRRAESFDELVAPDVVRHCEATPGLEARSLDDLKEFLRLDTAVFPDSVQTVQLLLAEGDLVATWTTYEGTQTGPMGPFPPSNRKVHFDFGAVFRMENGKIAEWWMTWDNMTILRALGHLPDG